MTTGTMRKARKKIKFALIEDKLAEADFFLGHLKHEKLLQARPNKTAPEHFRYYLSAFMTAARSVTKLIERSGQQSWQEQLKDAEKALHALATKLRNDSLYEGHIETTHRAEEVAIPFDPNPYQPQLLRFQALQLGQSGGGPWTIADTHYVECNGEPREVVEFCEQYFSVLTRVVQNR